MVGSSRRLTPGSFHGLFSTAVGVVTVQFVHSHQIGSLVAIQTIWLASMYFIHVRALPARGRFLGTTASTYYGLGVGGYLFGLLLVSLLYALSG